MCETGWKTLFGHRTHEPRTPSRPMTHCSSHPAIPDPGVQKSRGKGAYVTAGAYKLDLLEGESGNRSSLPPDAHRFPWGPYSPETLPPLSLMAKTATFDYHGLEVINSGEAMWALQRLFCVLTQLTPSRWDPGRLEGQPRECLSLEGACFGVLGPVMGDPWLQGPVRLPGLTRWPRKPGQGAQLRFL